MSLTGLFQREKAAVYLALALLTSAGLYSMQTLPAGAYPEAVFPRIVVLAKGGAFEPRDMVVAVTRPLEEAVSGVIDLRRIRSRTVRGGAELSLDFRPGADMQYALQQVQSRVSGEGASLPPGLEIAVERLTPSVFPMMQFELTGGDPVVLRDLAEFVIRPRLARLPDVGEVDVEGGLVREVSVVLDPTRLIASRIGLSEVTQAILASNQLTSAGRIDKEYRQFSVLVSGLAAGPDAVKQIVVRREGDRSVRVGDLGSVQYGAQDLFQLARGNGQPAALINVSRQPAGNSLEVEHAVEVAVAQVRPLLPAGVKMEMVYNQGALVRDSSGSVRDAMLIGGVLAVIVMFLFLGRPAIAVIAGISIPLTIAGTFVGLSLFHDTLNLMSLGGLAVAIGLIIDDAVVVVENVERNLALHPGEPVFEVIKRGTDEIFAPVAGSTLTTVVVFTPLGFLEGVVGQFFRSFSLALSVAVLLSLLIAMALIPLLAGEWLSRRGHGSLERPARFRISLAPVERAHARALGWLHRRRIVAMGIALGTAVLLVLLSRTIGTGFMPDMDEGGFIFDYWSPTGASLAETDALLGRAEKILRADPDIQSFTRRTGSELGFFATSPNRGDMTVLLKPSKQRKSSVYEVMNRVREQVETEVPALRIELIQILQDLIGDLAAGGKPVELKLFHPDIRIAERAAETVATAVDSVPGLVDLFNGVQGNLPELKVELDPVQVSRLGLSIEAASTEAKTALLGGDAGTVREPDRLVPIRVRLPDTVRFDPQVAARLPIIGPAGWATLGSLGRVHDTSDVTELTRENLRPYVAVTGEVDPTASSLGAVMKDIRRRLAGVLLPPGVTLEIGGQDASQRESFRQLLLVFALGAGAVLLVMVIQFRGFRGPLAIMMAAPLGLTGALLALALTGVPFNVSSFMGLILLIGLIVKNGIILLDAAHHFQDQGLAPADALQRAGQLRLRPILMTTLCTIAGLLPLVLGLGSGAELQRPLAIAVVGGLTLSTLVTLLLLPVGLEVLGALKQPPAS
ncbi:MAG TPA: efflux RND transporter permease subunit [Gemmatimonadales bacterium]|nr:efflux RND transporter permease subunit [Gemmatimonadales bacterium]